MNTSKTPAYLVYHNSQLDEPTRTFFYDATLLVARRAAMTFAESIFGSQATFTDEEEVEVYLVETICPDDPAPNTIARILQKHTPLLFAGNEGSPDADDAQLVKEHYKHVLLELQHEFDYYQANNLPDGFGSFGISVEMGDEHVRTNYVRVLFEAMGFAIAAISLYNGTSGHPFSVDYHPPVD